MTAHTTTSPGTTRRWALRPARGTRCRARTRARAAPSTSATRRCAMTSRSRTPRLRISSTTKAASRSRCARLRRTRLTGWTASTLRWVSCLGTTTLASPRPRGTSWTTTTCSPSKCTTGRVSRTCPCSGRGSRRWKRWTRPCWTSCQRGQWAPPQTWTRSWRSRRRRSSACARTWLFCSTASSMSSPPYTAASATPSSWSRTRNSTSTTSNTR
mmetsp:Transcript_15949/g.42977  ORF Transcript_15949/g.42977 Transcript_15949/m.42977 type:complete len:213 (+) Transcript_15949:485-1123(+)